MRTQSQQVVAVIQSGLQRSILYNPARMYGTMLANKHKQNTDVNPVNKKQLKMAHVQTFI